MDGSESVSLRQLCLKTLRRHISLDTALPLLEFARESNLRDSPYIESECLRFVKATFPAFVHREGRGRLEEFLGQATVSAMMREMDEVEDWKQRKASLRGVVLAQPQGAATTFQAEASGRNIATESCYPFAMLRRGAAWPPGIDPTRRELYLSAEEFAVAFKGLSIEAFHRLPAWKQRLVKQDADLH